MRKVIPIMHKCFGLTTRDSALMNEGPEKIFLKECSNVLVTAQGSIVGRNGYSQLDSAAWYSLAKNTQPLLGVRGSTLCMIYSDGSYHELTELTDNYDKVKYHQLKDTVYYVNGIDSGMITAHARFDLPTNDYTGIPAHLTFYGAVTGQDITVHNGRLFIANENAVWYSKRFRHGIFEFMGQMLQFESEVVMLESVRTGLWIGTKYHGVFWIGGAQPEEFAQVRASDASIIFNTESRIRGTKYGMGPGEFVFANGSEGPLLMGPDGSIRSLLSGIVDTDKYINGELPFSAEEGAGVVFQDFYLSLFS